MKLPEELQNRLEQLISGELDYEQLSKRYREGKTGFGSREERIAYLVARMPATFAALMQALACLKDFPIRSLVDWGAGPGTGYWAVKEYFPQLERAVLIERDREMMELGRKLTDAEWIGGNATAVEVPSSDLALFSYSLGEIRDASLFMKAWEKCRYLLVVEPGTPVGYQNILRARDLLIDHLIAPCPHAQVCPMLGTPNWCHFSARVERTRRHRLLKGGTLGHEDEKFSYVAFSKEPVDSFAGRIVGHPRKASGHVKLTLCMQNGKIEEKTISKRQGILYKWARKAEWGDACSEDLMSH